jgi:hypothetical protein
MSLLNPYSRIRELESMLQFSEQRLVSAEDQVRLLQAEIKEIRLESQQDRRDAIARQERVEDWMSSMISRVPIHGKKQEMPPPPEPVRRNTIQGRDLEQKLYAEAVASAEKSVLQ